MSSFITHAQPLPAHATFGAFWDPDTSEYVIGLTADTQLHLATADARALYVSIGTSLAERGAMSAPTDLHSRLEMLARSLHWEGHHGFARQVAAVLDPDHVCTTDCRPRTCLIAYGRLCETNQSKHNDSPETFKQRMLGVIEAAEDAAARS